MFCEMDFSDLIVTLKTRLLEARQFYNLTLIIDGSDTHLVVRGPQRFVGQC